MDPALLREQTRHEHETVESHMPVMEPGITRERYTAVLRCIYPMLRAWEAWAAENAPAELQPLVRERVRSPLIARDLECLGSALPAGAAFDGTQFKNPAAFLGAMYVLEGSTLGGQYIARHLEPLLGLSEACGTAYFRGYGAETGAKWREFQAHIAATPDEQSETVIAAAKAMFAIFDDAIAPLRAG